MAAVSCPRTPGLATASGLLSLFVLLVCVPDARAETLDRVVAIIEDEVVTFNDLRIDARIRLASANQRVEALDGAADRAQVLEMLLERLIQTRLLSAEAAKLQAPVGDAEVDQRLEMLYQRTRQTEQQYRALMGAQGIPWDAFRRFLRDELRSQFVVRTELGGQVDVSTPDVEACAREKQPEGQSTEKFELSQIVVTAEALDAQLGQESSWAKLYPAWWEAVDAVRYAAARQLYQMVRVEGLAFEDVAEQFSAGMSAKRRGQLGSFTRSDLSAEFGPVFELEVGELSDIIETEKGFHILRVDGRSQSSSESWQQTMEECRAELINLEGQKLIETWISNLAKRRFVKRRLNVDIAETAQKRSAEAQQAR
ncbi:MAG: peptidylprolyl isomerase [Myxococcota bacterium]|jgi:peptidyl-prolyl cis-trans isomerase SurA|nr:peptidylprolyl isomerase [Myxococcota bacterium]